MATRSIISIVATEGYSTETGSPIKINDERISWFGRYCHWDGYPEHMVPTIQQIVNRFGIAGAKTRLMSGGWSTLGTDGAGHDLDFKTIGDNDMVGSRIHEGDPFLLDGGDDWGTEYRYLIKDEGMLEVYKVSYDKSPHTLIDTYPLGLKLVEAVSS